MWCGSTPPRRDVPRAPDPVLPIGDLPGDDRIGLGVLTVCGNGRWPAGVGTCRMHETLGRSTKIDHWQSGKWARGWYCVEICTTGVLPADTALAPASNAQRRKARDSVACRSGIGSAAEFFPGRGWRSGRVGRLPVGVGFGSVSGIWESRNAGDVGFGDSWENGPFRRRRFRSELIVDGDTRVFALGRANPRLAGAAFPAGAILLLGPPMRLSSLATGREFRVVDDNPIAIEPPS